MRNDRVAVFEGYVRANTGRAIQFESHYWEGAIWFPLSQVSLHHDGDMGHVIEVKEWLVKKRGIAEFTYYSAAEIERVSLT